MQKEGEKTRRYFAPALEKGLDILEALASADVPLSLTELASVLKRTPSELFRMLNLLEQRAYVHRDSISNSYELTLKLHELAHTHSPVDLLLKAASLPTRTLTQLLRESCHLSVLSVGKLMVVFQAESPEPVRLSVEVGYRALPLSTASGRLLVAFLPDAEREAFLDRDELFQKYSRAERNRCLADLETVRRQGFLVAESSRRSGLDVACVVGSPRVRVIAALGIPFLPGGPNQGMEAELVSPILKCAAQIAGAMGVTQFSGEPPAT